MALSPSSTLCRSSFMRAWRVAARNNSVSLGSSSMCKTAVSGSRAAWAPPEPPRDLEEFDRDPIRFRISDIRRTTACAHSERSKPLPTSAILHRTHLWRVVKEKSEVLQAFQVLFVTDETVGGRLQSRSAPSPGPTTGAPRLSRGRGSMYVFARCRPFGPDTLRNLFAAPFVEE